LGWAIGLNGDRLSQELGVGVAISGLGERIKRAIIVFIMIAAKMDI
jgi:hypothetical protein